MKASKTSLQDFPTEKLVQLALPLLNWTEEALHVERGLIVHGALVWPLLTPRTRSRHLFPQNFSIG